jgi:hypothetical protein
LRRASLTSRRITASSSTSRMVEAASLMQPL